MKNGGAMFSNSAKIKEEPDDMETEEEDGAPPAFGPAALGLHRVGTTLPPKPTPTQPLQKLNARGMPARIRKKNRLFFDDNIVNAPPPRASPKRGPKTTPAKTPSKLSMSASKKQKSPSKTPRILRVLQQDNGNNKSVLSLSPDRKTGQKIGMRLRNLLKLPKAHKWVCFEHFYSNIDKPLFEGENDFTICLKESFPKLSSRKLTQVQWTKIRRMMGKPRRCSQAFFSEERKDLERKRQKIRFLQQRKNGNICCKDLPTEIPMQLVVGSKVTARLRKPQDGLFTGVIDAVDTSNNTYRITFERPGLGTHSVPDFEVLSNEPPDTLNLTNIISQQLRLRHGKPEHSNHQAKSYSGSASEKSYNDPLLGSGSGVVKPEDASTIGGYPAKFLEHIVRITKILNAKKNKIKMLQEFNSEIEKKKSFGERMPVDFERRYAAVVIELEKMNMDLQDYLNEVQVYCHEISPGLCEDVMLAPSHLREKCKDEASQLVNKNNMSSVKNEKILDLIIDLTALMLQVKSLSDSEQNAYELKVLQGTMDQIKLKLQPTDQHIFQNCVEIHMQRIQMGLGPVGLGACNMPTST